MRILKFDGAIGPVSAFRITNKGKTHYNIKWGTYAKGGWCISFGVSDKIIDDYSSKEIIMNKTDYTLMPVIGENGECRKDKKDNMLYYINRRYNYDDGKVLLFVNLIKWAGKDISFRVSPSVTIVGKGADVVTIGEKLISAPSYIILMTEGSECLIGIGSEKQTILTVKNGQLQIKA